MRTGAIYLVPGALHRGSGYEFPFTIIGPVFFMENLIAPWMSRIGYHADIAGLRARYPGVGWHTLEAWAASQD